MASSGRCKDELCRVSIRHEADSTSLKQLLQAGARLRHKKTRRTCRNTLKLEKALWTFVRVEGVEPTNNLAAPFIYATSFATIFF